MPLAPVLRAQLTPHRFAQLAIFVQFVATVRSLGEIYRLAWVRGESFTFGDASPFLIAGIIGLAFTWAAVLLYFFRRDRLVIVAAALMVAVLIVYKAMAIGLG